MSKKDFSKQSNSAAQTTQQTQVNKQKKRKITAEMNKRLKNTKHQ
jgi:hypothetical protein